MSLPPLIGIYSRPDDDHLPRVLAALHRRRLRVIRFDRADFPLSVRLMARFGSEPPGWQGEMVVQQKCIRLDEIRSLWYRRPGRTSRFVAGLSEAGSQFARAEAQRGFEGLLRSLPCLWVSDPDAIRAAEWKPKQLAFAQRLGLRVPRTLLTNDPQAALQFFDAC